VRDRTLKNKMEKNSAMEAELSGRRITPVCKMALMFTGFVSPYAVRICTAQIRLPFAWIPKMSQLSVDRHKSAEIEACRQRGFCQPRSKGEMDDQTR